jgi:small subunit ribosomal protein S21
LDWIDGDVTFWQTRGEIMPIRSPSCPKAISVQVIVRENNVDQALRALKKKMQREGIFRELKMRDHYEKPSEKKAREKAEAVRRSRKLARKIAQKESGIAPPPRPGFKAGAGGGAGRGGAGAPRPSARPAI